MKHAYFHAISALLLGSAFLLTGCGEDEAKMEEAIAEEVKASLQPLVDQTRRLEKRLRLVETENGQLKSDLEALALAAKEQSASPTASTVTEPEADAMKAQLEEVIGDRQEVASYFAQVAQQQILAHEEQKRLEAEREREERHAREREERAARDAERTASMASDMGLNEEQATQLLAARTAMREAMSEMFRFAREEGNFDREQMRELMGELHEKHNQALAAFMSEEQMKAYQEMNDHWWGGGRRGRGR